MHLKNFKKTKKSKRNAWKPASQLALVMDASTVRGLQFGRWYRRRSQVFVWYNYISFYKMYSKPLISQKKKPMCSILDLGNIFSKADSSQYCWKISYLGDCIMWYGNVILVYSFQKWRKWNNENIGGNCPSMNIYVIIK